MARKKKVGEHPQGVFCKDCSIATDFHEIGYDGKPFLCKCKFQTRSMFLKHDCCSNFQQK